MFIHALDALGIPPEGWGRGAMVGNNLARDIRGANQLGLVSVWFAWNERYPLEPAAEDERPCYQAGSADELRALLAALDRGEDPPEFAYPRPFAWRTKGSKVEG
jgi:putative hydrolase of the HAD superfamily